MSSRTSCWASSVVVIAGLSLVPVGRSRSVGGLVVGIVLCGERAVEIFLTGRRADPVRAVEPAAEIDRAAPFRAERPVRPGIRGRARFGGQRTLARRTLRRPFHRDEPKDRTHSGPRAKNFAWSAAGAPGRSSSPSG